MPDNNSSIDGKIVKLDSENLLIKYAEKYGYTFEHEATYEKMCLVNDAVYIAKHDGKWDATGAQFAVPYVFTYTLTGCATPIA